MRLSSVRTYVITALRNCSLNEPVLMNWTWALQKVPYVIRTCASLSRSDNVRQVL